LIYITLSFSIFYLYLREFKDIEILIGELKESFGFLMEGDFSWRDYLKSTKEVVKMMKSDEI